MIDLFSEITGQNILQSFTSKDFSYLNDKHQSIQEKLKKNIEKDGKAETINNIVGQLSILLIPQSNIENQAECAATDEKIIKEFVEKWVDLTMEDKPEKYSDRFITMLKNVFGKVMENNSKYAKD